MKTLRSTLTVIALLFAGVAANAAGKPGGQLSQSDVVNIYISAITNGKTADLDKVLSDDLQFNMHRGDNVNTLSKAQLLKYLKNNAPSNETASANSTTLIDDENTARIKVEFKYDGYTRTDVISLDKTFGWQITSINSTYK